MNESPEVNEGENNFDSNDIQNPSSEQVKKKNRTLQYYKFLFYSLKTEIKAQDFLKLLRTSNVIEIAIWIISLLLYANTPKDFPRLRQGERSSSYKNSFIWFHLLHVIRGGLGIFIAHTLPRSYQVTESLETLSDSKLETTLFNDLIRETIFFSVTEKIKSKKIPIIAYLILTALNFIFDIIDFFVIVSSLSKARSDAKVVLLTYLLIAGIYITVDLAYILWSGQLTYIFPKQYLKPIDGMFSGIVDFAMKTFKLGKPKTNVISEAKAQQGGGPYVIGSDMNNGGVNILENIIGNSFGREVHVQQDGIQNNNEQNKVNNRPSFPEGNYNANSNDPIGSKYNEQKLDNE